MFCNVILLLFLLLTVSAVNSFHKRTSTEKPGILVEDPSKSVNPPTHISEFTDPDTGLNPFLDLEEGPTFIGRNVMKDENRDDPPFMDFEMVEGDASDRRWIDFSKEPMEEPFQQDVKSEEKSTTTSQPFTSETDGITTTILSRTTVSGEEILCDDENREHKIKKELAISEFSNVTMVYALVAIAILATVLFLLVGSCWWRRRKMARTTTESREC